MSNAVKVILAGIATTVLWLIPVLLVMSTYSCAFVEKIPQDQPMDATQCFQSKFNIHRIISEEWKIAHQHGNIFFLANPEKGKYPKIVAVLLHPTGLIMRYAYLDGKEIVAYVFHVKDGKGCYVVDNSLTPEIKEMLTTKIHLITKERFAKK